jgi:hypothetical protein
MGEVPASQYCCPLLFSAVYYSRTPPTPTKNTPPHLVIVSSDAHLQTLSPERKLEKILSILNTEASFAGKEFDHCSVSKLSEAFIAIELVNLTPVVDGNLRVIASYVTAVFVKTGMGVEEQFPLALRVLQYFLARTPGKPSLCYVDAARKRKESHGRCLNHQMPHRQAGPKCLSPELETNFCRPGCFVRSDEGVAIRGKVFGGGSLVLWRRLHQM